MEFLTITKKETVNNEITMQCPVYRKTNYGTYNIITKDFIMYISKVHIQQIDKENGPLSLDEYNARINEILDDSEDCKRSEIMQVYDNIISNLAVKVNKINPFRSNNRVKIESWLVQEDEINVNFHNGKSMAFDRVDFFEWANDGEESFQLGNWEDYKPFNPMSKTYWKDIHDNKSDSPQIKDAIEVYIAEMFM